MAKHLSLNKRFSWKNLQWALQISSPAQSEDMWSVVTGPGNGSFQHLGLSRDNTTPLFSMGRWGQEIVRAAREGLHLRKRLWKSKDPERLRARTARLGGQWYLSESQGRTVLQGWEAETQGSETAASHKACTSVCSAQEAGEWDVELPYVYADAPSTCAPLMYMGFIPSFEIGSESSRAPGGNSWEFTDLRCCD